MMICGAAEGHGIRPVLGWVNSNTFPSRILEGEVISIFASPQHSDKTKHTAKDAVKLNARMILMMLSRFIRHALF